MRVDWTRTALANLQAEAEFIGRDDPEAARRVIATIWAAVERLRQYPAMGRVGRVPGTRELVVSSTPYLVPYRIREDRIEILRVLHSSRRWPRSF